MSVDHEFKGSAISLCCEECGEGHSYHKNNYCPSCASLRAKLDREKLARIIGISILEVYGVHSLSKGEWEGKVADAIIAYLKDG